jgi:hypothetical protein
MFGHYLHTGTKKFEIFGHYICTQTQEVLDIWILCAYRDESPKYWNTLTKSPKHRNENVYI